jgi:hypothetical protein
MDNKREYASPYTELYWLVQDKKIDANIFFCFLELFWPSFVKKDKFVFLKEKFSEDEFVRLVKDNANPEYWINLLTVDDFFPETPDGEKNSTILAKSLIQSWEAKLKIDFPDMKFKVKYVYDEEYGDYGLTFYQIYPKV